MSDLALTGAQLDGVETSYIGALAGGVGAHLNAAANVLLDIDEFTYQTACQIIDL